MKPLRVCIDARLGGEAHGGVEQVVIGLASGLASLEGDEEYRFLTLPGADEWLRPYMGGSCSILRLGEPDLEPGPAGLARRQLRAVGSAFRRRRVRSRNRAGLASGVIEPSDGTIEASRIDVMHFPLTLGFLTAVPSIYQPHDLQHVHMPEAFTEAEVARRQVAYRAYCEQARLIVMMTSWGKRDLVENFRLDPGKVAVVPGGSVVSSYPQPSPADVAATRDRYSLPESFLLYPAQTWAHKNHLKLIEALASLRDRQGAEVALVCPGRKHEFFSTIEARVGELGLDEQVVFPGFVTPLELRCLYELARGLIFPSLFEGWGLPISEAFEAGLPVAASSATGNPDVVGDAGLIFDPRDAAAIGDAALRLWTDASLREELAAAGHRRTKELSIEHMARLFRAHYRRIAGRKPSSEDREILAAPPLA